MYYIRFVYYDYIFILNYYIFKTNQNQDISGENICSWNHLDPNILDWYTFFYMNKFKFLFVFPQTMPTLC